MTVDKQTVEGRDPPWEAVPSSQPQWGAGGGYIDFGVRVLYCRSEFFFFFLVHTAFS